MTYDNIKMLYKIINTYSFVLIVQHIYDPIYKFITEEIFSKNALPNVIGSYLLSVLKF